LTIKEKIIDKHVFGMELNKYFGCLVHCIIFTTSLTCSNVLDCLSHTTSLCFVITSLITFSSHHH